MTKVELTQVTHKKYSEAASRIFARPAELPPPQPGKGLERWFGADGRNSPQNRRRKSRRQSEEPRNTVTLRIDSIDRFQKINRKIIQ